MNLLDRKSLEKEIDKVVKTYGDKDIIIYPYGEIGQYADVYLKSKYGISKKYAIDNKKANGKDILSLDQIDEAIDAIFVVCSSTPECYEEIREKLYNKIDYQKIIDPFNKEDSYWKKVNDNYEMRNVLWYYAYDNNEVIHRAKYLAAFWKYKNIEVNEDDIFAGDVGIASTYNFTDYGFRNNQADIAMLPYYDELTKAESEDYINAERMGLICRNPSAHATAAYTRLLNEGITPRYVFIINKLNNNKRNSNSELTFYKSEKIIIDGFRQLIKRYAVEADELYKKTGKDNARIISDSCSWLVDNPPRSFYQAIQMMLFIHIGVISENGCGSFSFGRIDQYLYPFYKADIENGSLTKEQAQKYITAFWQKLSEMERGWQNVTIGGSNGDKDECNEITLMCINAAKEIRGQQPQLSLRVGNNMPEDIWDKAIDLISCGMGFPSLFNDYVCKKALKGKRFSDEDAENYSVMGCVELLVEGKEFSHQEGLRFNFVKFLEVLLHSGKCALTSKSWSLEDNKNISDIKDFEELYTWYKSELIITIKRICKLIDITSNYYGKFFKSPFLSVVMDGPIEKGRDIHDSSTIYNNLTICGVGTGEVADCLEAIKCICFEEKAISLQLLISVLDSDFDGYEDLQKRLLNCPKYGNDIDSVDHLCADIVKTFTDTVTGYQLKNRDGVMQVGFYTSYFHADFGEKTAASPDGRKAKMPLSPSLSPMAGMDKNGVLAILNSANKIDMCRFGNSMALDIKFSPKFFEEKDNQKALINMVKTYFDNGGMEIQFNVIDADTLRKAQKSPDEYRNIIVRVAGFSARFVELSKKLQDEIICRTENVIC